MVTDSPLARDHQDRQNAQHVKVSSNDLSGAAAPRPHIGLFVVWKVCSGEMVKMANICLLLVVIA